MAEAVLQTEFPDWGLLLQLQAFRAPRDLGVSSHTRDQLLHLSAAFGLGAGHVLSEYEDKCPVATHFATHIAAATATDVSIKAWQRTVEHVGKKASENLSLIHI